MNGGFDDWDAVLKELKRISESEYKETDHERNHQTFAKALWLIMEKVRFQL